MTAETGEVKKKKKKSRRGGKRKGKTVKEGK